MDQEKDSRSARRRGGERFQPCPFPKIRRDGRNVRSWIYRKTAFTRRDSTLMECRACDGRAGDRESAARGFKHQNNSKLAPRIGGRAWQTRDRKVIVRTIIDVVKIGRLGITLGILISTMNMDTSRWLFRVIFGRGGEISSIILITHRDYSYISFFFFFSFIITSERCSESFIVYLGKKYQVFNNSWINNFKSCWKYMLNFHSSIFEINIA